MNSKPVLTANHLVQEMLIEAAPFLAASAPNRQDVLRRFFQIADDFVKLSGERAEAAGEQP